MIRQCLTMKIVLVAPMRAECSKSEHRHYKTTEITNNNKAHALGMIDGNSGHHEWQQGLEEFTVSSSPTPAAKSRCYDFPFGKQELSKM